MKKCPFCAEEIQDEAIKCKHCDEFIDPRMKEALQKAALPEKKVSWMFSPMSIIISIITVGPLALPLIWFHPKYSMLKKFVLTAIVVAITIFLGIATAKGLQTMMKYYNGIVGQY